MKNAMKFLPFFVKDSRLNDVLDVSARRADPRQNRIGDAYEGNYNSGLHHGGKGVTTHNKKYFSSCKFYFQYVRI